MINDSNTLNPIRKAMFAKIKMLTKRKVHKPLKKPKLLGKYNKKKQKKQKKQQKLISRRPRLLQNLTKKSNSNKSVNLCHLMEKYGVLCKRPGPIEDDDPKYAGIDDNLS